MRNEFNQQVLEAALAQSLESGALRQVLVNVGIPEQEDVTLRITDCAGIVIDNFEIPKTNHQYVADPTETNFDQALRKFFDDAEKDFDLLKAFPQSAPLFPDDETTETAFILTFKSNNVKKVTALGCCYDPILGCTSC